MELPASFVTISSPVLAIAKASSPDSRASPPVNTENLRGNAGNVTLSFLEKEAGLIQPTMMVSSTSSRSSSSSASVNNITATGSDLDAASLQSWLKNRPKSSDSNHLQLTTGKELEEVVHDVERKFMKILSTAKTTEERTKALEAFVRTNGIQVIGHLETLLTKQAEGNKTLSSMATQQSSMAAKQTKDSATLSSMATQQSSMAANQATDSATLKTMAIHISTLLTEMSELKTKLSEKDGQEEKTDAKAIAADSDVDAENIEPAAASNLLPKGEERKADNTTGIETGIHKVRAENNKLKKEVDHLRMQRAKAQQVTKFLSNHKTAEQILAEMENAPSMPAQQKESLAKHQHRMHPKTQEDAAKKRSGKGGRMRFRY